MPAEYVRGRVTRKRARCGAQILAIENYAPDRESDTETAISDAVCDLMHLAAAKGLNWSEIADRASNHFVAEGLQEADEMEFAHETWCRRKPIARGLSCDGPCCGCDPCDAHIDEGGDEDDDSEGGA